MTFKVLSLDSLDSLSSYIAQGQELERVYLDFENLMHDLSLCLVDSHIPKGFDHLELTVPDETTLSKKHSDEANIEIIWSVMRELTPAQATDPRLWTTLALINCREYALARWPMPSSKDQIRAHLVAHWLCKVSVRSRIRDHSIARLWWMASWATRIDGWNRQEVISILLNNSDYRQQLLDRSTSASAVSVVAAILTLTKDAMRLDIAYDRKKFRLFMEQVNYIAVRTSLVSLDVSEVLKIVKPIWQKYYEED